MAKNQLSSEDKLILDDFVQLFEAGFEAIEKAKQIAVGDYLILHLHDPVRNEMVQQKNSYGAPIKFKVVYCSKHGIPFVKRVNKKGEPVGRLFSCMGALHTDYFHKPGQKFEFSLDPDYADSILLQDEYDPAQLHKSKKDIWKTVTDHNKAHKIKTRHMNDVIAFVSTVKVGDMLWTSRTGYFLVQNIAIKSPRDFNATAKHIDRTHLKLATIVVLTIKDKKGTVKDVAPNFFYWKALYRERPRTYKELNI